MAAHLHAVTEANAEHLGSLAPDPVEEAEWRPARWSWLVAWRLTVTAGLLAFVADRILG